MTMIHPQPPASWTRATVGFLRKHPLASYFTLVFALSWGGVLAVIVPGPIPAPPPDAERRFAFVYLAMLVGPSVAGLVMTGIVSGREGLRAFLGRLLRWRVGARWYAAAVLTAPLVLLATVGVMSRFSPDFTPALFGGLTAGIGPMNSSNLASFILTGVLIGAGAGFFEELGWTGFATPTMRLHRGVSATGVVVGLLWGAWHFLAVFWGSAQAFGSVPVPLFMLVALFTFLPPYRVLMVRVYDRTGSLLLGILMHAALTASMILLGPPVAGRAAVAYDVVLGAALWGVVALTGRLASGHGRGLAESGARPRSTFELTRQGEGHVGA